MKICLKLFYQSYKQPKIKIWLNNLNENHSNKYYNNLIKNNKILKIIYNKKE